MTDGGKRSAPRGRMISPALRRIFGGSRPRRRDRSGVDEPQTWWPGGLIWALTSLSGFAVLVFLVWLGWSAFVIVNGGPSALPYDPDRRCTSLGFTCGAVSNVLISVLLLAVASFFVLWRLFRLLRWYRVRARTGSRELVPTAGAILDEVVGRDELCKVVMADLRERRKRPHVLVGGVGTGKTAVLVRLTELLADKRAVPVPVRLRDATNVLDFESLARERFLNEVNQRLISSAEGETIWRRLRKEGRIVVLADGLEEALVGTTAEQDRDNVIRAAIRKAHQERLPLVIASRPHDPLRASEAAILALEPLSYEAALAYIGGDGTSEDDRRLARIVETADVVEAPLYLQITRELQVKGLLYPGSGGQQVVNTRGADRAQLRLALLETWQRALISGHLREDVPLNRAERLAAVEHLSALACVGLRGDSLEVPFSELGPEQKIATAVQARLDKIDGDAGHLAGVRNIDVRLAAAWAAQLELVELRGDSVRFQHSLIQAYLGSRLLDVALEDPAYCEQALKPPGPGREFLIAMVLRSRATSNMGRRHDLAAHNADVSASRALAPALKVRGIRRKGTPASQDVQQRYVDLMRQRAAKRDDNKALDMYAAALEIDCGAPVPAHRIIADTIKDQWSRIHAQDPKTLEEGKLTLVRRFGEAAHRLDDRRKQGEKNLDLPAFRQLYEIACIERSYPVSLAAAQELGAGGDTAYRELSEILAAPCPVCDKERAERQQRLSGPRPGHATGNSAAMIISAWLAPMLAGSVGATGADQTGDLAKQARADLDQWLRHIGRYGRRSGEEDLDITLEIAVAQGFKHAANRRPAHAGPRHETRIHLAERTLEMLKGTEYWFSQLTLIQALCLLNLSGQPKQAADQHGAKPEAIVQHWLDVAGRDSTDRNQPTNVTAELHPFVREAAQLAVLALKTGKPQRYLWIDESGVVGQVGSRKASATTTHRQHRLWIPPSAGWTALNGRAQQLVADVLLLLSLADRGDQPHDSERRLKRSNRYDLPPCITRYRPALDPGLTVGTATSAAPGTRCVDGCAFELCPYPPKGAQPRVEMSEAFCRRQQTLLTRRSLNHRKAPWQEMRRRQLIQFWAEMADRARGPRPRSAATGR